MRALCALLLALAWAHAAPAQEPWPSRSITVVVPYAPGAAPDLIAREIADKLAPALGQPIVINNRPGSNGLIGGEAAAHSRPDGYTLLIGGDGLLAVAPHLYRKYPFDPLGDLIPVVSLVENVFLLVVNPALPAMDLRAFLELARAANPPLAYGSSGNGSQAHLTMERLQQLAGVRLLHVPFRSNNQAAMAILSGDIAAAFVGASGAHHVRTGRLRPLATTSPVRTSANPDVPALNETFPGLEMVNWQGLFVPAGTPAPIVQRLAAAVRAVLASDELVRRLTSTGDVRLLVQGPEEFARRIRRDSEKYRQIVESLGLKLD